MKEKWDPSSVMQCSIRRYIMQKYCFRNPKIDWLQYVLMWYLFSSKIRKASVRNQPRNGTSVCFKSHILSCYSFRLEKWSHTAQGMNIRGYPDFRHHFCFWTAFHKQIDRSIYSHTHSQGVTSIKSCISPEWFMKGIKCLLPVMWLDDSLYRALYPSRISLRGQEFQLLSPVCYNLLLFVLCVSNVAAVNKVDKISKSLL